MRKSACLLVSIAVLILLPHWLRAQSLADSVHPRWLIGALGGYNLIAYNTDEFSIPGTEPGFRNAQNASGHDWLSGGALEIPLDRSMENFIVFEVSYDGKDADFGLDSWLPASSGNFDTAYALSGQLTYYVFNIGYKFNFFSGSVPTGIGVQLCASVGYIFQKNFNRTMYIYTTNNLDVPINKVSELYPIPSVASFRLALRPELTYDIPIRSQWLLTPSIGYDAPITKVDPSLNWTANSLYFGLAVQYMFQ
jgi:hypothetical protein